MGQSVQMRVAWLYGSARSAVMQYVVVGILSAYLSTEGMGSMSCGSMYSSAYGTAQSQASKLALMRGLID
ncbi:hypothetical protein AWN76_011305 [Rhodothermaceae bacterium RA]|nr:hypothetical protein AWN76_011305 [Rhodothermaceae bacterium RA]